MIYNEWMKLIEEFKVSGKTQSDWCKEKGIKVKAFNFHYRKYRRDENIKQAKNKSEYEDKIEWIPVKQIKPLKRATLDVRIGKAIIQIENDYDESLFLKVVKSLEVLC